MTNIAIIKFPGSNCDLDVKKIYEEILDVKAELIWYKQDIEKDYDGVIIPGGFSYGDYLRSGAIAAKTPIMESIKEYADNGGKVFGICNGFQILTEVGLLPGTLMTNKYPKFKCQSTYIRIESNSSVFTSNYNENEVIKIPIAHKDGNYIAKEKTYREIKENDQIAFKYVDEKGRTTQKSNPNGSKDNIAGVMNQEKNILGMMPHPERASDKLLRSNDGLKILKSIT
ncbi:Phosphoribosylformylglycinamidine (FGAM) synthase glutamine amidotransferase domain [Methanonatronarchaeum thermophilum]|uniref:Phosphoribosylformylglycinamidine synthase subunit PurQ n=1 Tax=Methanonatronarchaeum thermophilum TaxID=1927129 RepID=A0A1Y3G9Q8_9EURY|nr:phosphoribosylformylglycinamidine synthase I [Methanonatronarchaeum thermophilum]OUJ18171.1 Phosphoribosylformylglycinamidine (FGAM) synthase glutamine amidotransferase domain [Methanonatronarchaeum thermophilum]